MKNFDTDQRLLLLDLPPTIPASLNTLNLDYVADTYHPSHYKLSDLPEKIPIINEKTGSFRRFIKRKTPKDKRRVVSAPPGTLRQKELPKPPGMSGIHFLQLLHCHLHSHLQRHQKNHIDHTQPHQDQSL